MPYSPRKKQLSQAQSKSRGKKKKKKQSDNVSISSTGDSELQLDTNIFNQLKQKSINQNKVLHDSVNENEVQQVNKKRSIRDIIGDSDSSTDSDSDSDDGNYLEQDIKCTQSSSSPAAKIHIPPNSIEAAIAVPKPLSKSQRINRNKRI